MKKEEYKTIYSLEYTHWWYRGLDHLLFQTIKKLHGSGLNKVLDAGCGTGRVLHKLPTQKERFGIDYSPEALKFCKQMGLIQLSR